MSHTDAVWAEVLAQLDPNSRRRFASPGELATYLSPPYKNSRGEQQGIVQTPTLELIDVEMTTVANTPESRLAISVPPQEGKTTRVRDFILWTLMDNPGTRIVFASYNQSLANESGRYVRNTIETHPELGLKIAPDNGSKSEWTLEGHRGGMLSVGRGVGVSGRPADLVIIDDPFKEGEAQSSTIREAAWSWWTQGIAARFGPNTRVIVIHTRWHEDDLIGRLLTRDAHAGWRYVNVAAQCENPATDPLGRQAGEYMVSARGRNERQWEQRKLTAGSRAWQALYQGAPSPLEGDIFKRNNWRYYSKLPDLTTCKLYQSWDLTLTNTKTSDFAVGQVWAHQPSTNRFYLLDQARGRWNFTETIAQIIAMSNTWPTALTKLIEAKASGHSAINMLEEQGMVGLVPIVPREGKVFRAEVVSPIVEGHSVILPIPAIAPWIGGLVEEAAAFPNAPHDDQVDALTQFLSHVAIPNQDTKGWSSGFINMG